MLNSPEFSTISIHLYFSSWIISTLPFTCIFSSTHSNSLPPFSQVSSVPAGETSLVTICGIGWLTLRRWKNPMDQVGREVGQRLAEQQAQSTLVFLMLPDGVEEWRMKMMMWLLRLLSLIIIDDDDGRKSKQNSWIIQEDMCFLVPDYMLQFDYGSNCWDRKVDTWNGTERRNLGFQTGTLFAGAGTYKDAMFILWWPELKFIVRSALQIVGWLSLLQEMVKIDLCCHPVRKHYCEYIGTIFVVGTLLVRKITENWLSCKDQSWSIIKWNHIFYLPHPQCNRGNWRFSSGFRSLKIVKILLVTEIVAGGWIQIISNEFVAFLKRSGCATLTSNFPSILCV